MSEIITASLTVSGGDTITVNLNTLARGPAGTGGGGSNSVTSATTSDGTANLSISNVTTATATVSGIMTAPTAATTTSTTQVATTAFVQQELASGVTVARNLEFLAHNGSGATIAKGSIVYINGAVSGVPRITKSQANNNANSARTIGFVKADIADGANGFVIIEGELLNVSTADSSGIIGPGIQIYLSPTTPGAFTRTKPSAPQHIVYVGVVVTASTGANLDGKILVGIQNGYELNEIHDVSITTPVAKQVIKRNAGSTLWVNEAIVSADVSDATNNATPSTLVRRDANGGARFGDVETSIITASGISTTGQVEFNGTDAGDSLTFNMVNYTYGTGAASAHRFALNGGAATGDALFTAASASAARTTLELGTANAVEFTRINVTGNSGVNGGLSWITSGALQGVTWKVHSGNIGVLFIARAGQGDMLSVNSGMSIGWSSNSSNAHVTGTHDLRLWRDGAGTLAQRNGTNAQTSLVYGTYTDASNYRRLSLNMSAAGVAELKPEGIGTGVSGNVLHISGLPTSNPGLGILWNDAGTVKVGT